MLPLQVQPAVPGTQHRGPKCTGPPAFRVSASLGLREGRQKTLKETPGQQALLLFMDREKAVELKEWTQS